MSFKTSRSLPPATLNITGLGILGTGILVDNTNAYTLTITATIEVNNDQAWTNNSGNLFTVSGNVSLGGNALTVNGTGNTLISGAGSLAVHLIKDGSGMLTLTGNNIYSGGTAVNGGTLLVNNTVVPAPEPVRNGQQRWHYPWRNRHSRGDSGAAWVEEQTLRPGMAAITPEFLPQPARSHYRRTPIF